ncbi:hypothetical protein SCHPADRAFT_930212 [Schizopora paradoxa]|uniref:Uncharacterized protein n=1 Tax=Schizopora paradoxa TaxID=27342 RepID=A0A0H2RGM3_9AGAM|nr:hypothetical protein SCHPADRAFT_930212 [Schizopora paradoxa]
MPRPRKAIPNWAILDKTETAKAGAAQYYCSICQPSRTLKRTFGASNLSKHPGTTEHQQAVYMHNIREQIASARMANASLEANQHFTLDPIPDADFDAPEIFEPEVEPVSHYNYYHAFDGTEVVFDVGQHITASHQHAEIARLRHEIEVFEQEIDKDFEGEYITVSDALAELRACGMVDIDDAVDEDCDANTSQASSKAEASLSKAWAPYRNKTMFLLDVLDNLPRLRLSDAQLRVIFFVMRETGSKDVPSLTTFRRFQQQLREGMAVQTKRHQSGQGNVFYENDLPRQVAEFAFANPLVRPHVKFYPKDLGGAMSELWHGEKWCKDLDPDFLTPMTIGYKDRHFYVNELTQCHDKSLVIPQRWIVRNGEMSSDSYSVLLTENGTLEVDVSKTRDVPLGYMRLPYPDLVKRRPHMMDKIRAKANGKPCFAIQIRVWGDDVSGNRSKQWNKHYIWCMTLAGLPKKLLNQEYFMQFISCSPHATALEQATAICNAIKKSRDRVIAYDSSLGREVMFFINLFQELSDNPMLAELCSHIGLRGNMLCYRCWVGGTQDYKTTDEGYHSLFAPGKLRNVDETRTEVLGQMDDLAQGNFVEDRQRLTGVKDSLLQQYADSIELQRNDAMDSLHDSEIELDALQEAVDTSVYAWLGKQCELINPFLELPGFDPHRDGPVEPLHTVLLGVIKYSLALTCKVIDAQNKLPLFQARLASVEIDGLNIPPLRPQYLIQHRGSLIGRNFKQLMQLLVFVLHDLTSVEIRQLWVTAGSMAAILWYPEIKNVTAYSDELQHAINNFLDALVAVDPSRITTKPKCHILTHTPADIQRFAPSQVLSTETFEGFNGVFRLCSVLSNHHAPSRDIGVNLSNIGRLRHISPDDTSGTTEWIQAGPEVRKFVSDNPEILEHLGWSSTRQSPPGCFRRPAKVKLQAVNWHSHCASQAIPILLPPTATFEAYNYVHCTSMIATTGDVVKKGSFIASRKDEHSELLVGRVKDIFNSDCVDANPRGIVVIERFSVGGQHSELYMPTIHRYAEPIIFLAGPEASLNSEFNLNTHGIANLNDSSSTSNLLLTHSTIAFVLQEREETSVLVSVVKHGDEDHFVVNAHALHNAQLLRQVFPPELFKTPDITVNRSSFHMKLAEKIRDEMRIKKAATKAKRAATAKRKAEARANADKIQT